MVPWFLGLTPRVTDSQTEGWRTRRTLLSHACATQITRHLGFVATEEVRSIEVTLNHFTRVRGGSATEL